MSQDKVRWKAWADSLRQSMMVGLRPQVTKSIDEISRETSTDKSPTVLKSRRFWNSCQAGQGTNDTISRAGLEIDFEPNDTGSVENVTFRLNNTWQSIMQRVVDRQV